MNFKRSVFFLLVLLLSLPLLAQAALVPCGTGSDIAGATNCQACHLVSLIQNVITFIITVAVPVMGILVAYAGFLYFSSGVSSENIGRAKSIFFSTLIGFIIMLGAWLIINFILQTLVGGQLGGAPWNRIQCAAEPKQSGAQSKGAVAVKKSDERVCVEPDPLFPGACVRYADQAPGTSRTFRNGYEMRPGTRSLANLQDGYQNSAQYEALIQAAAARHNVPADEIRAIMMIESNGRSGEVSPARASGLMQLLPGTAKDLDPNLKGLSESEIIERLKNPAYNIDLGARYYSIQRNRWGDPDLAAAAYNGGPGANNASRDCSGLLVWQCTKDCTPPGSDSCRLSRGTEEIRKYVPDARQARDFIVARKPR